MNLKELIHNKKLYDELSPYSIFLYPLFLFKQVQQKDYDKKANNDNRAVAVAPRKLRHILKIHTVLASNKIKRQKYGGYNCKYLH